MSTQDQLAAYGLINNFYLTPTAIVTYYNTYEIAPFAAGLITIELPFCEIQNLLSANGPLMPFIEKL